MWSRWSHETGHYFSLELLAQPAVYSGMQTIIIVLLVVVIIQYIKIMVTNQEIVAKLEAANTQITKLKGDVGFIQQSVTDLKAEVARLQEVIANGGDNTAIAAAVDSLAANLQSLDDGIPELETPAPEPIPAPPAGE